MRNTLQYPITKDEVIRAIDVALEKAFDPDLIGDHRPLALTKAKEFIIKHGPDLFYERFDPRSNSND